MNVIIALSVIALVATLIIKKYKSQAVLITAAFVLMGFAYALGYKGAFVPKAQSLGHPVLDMFEYVALLLSKDVSHLGLMIMTITGFAKYMDHIGASSTLVQLAMHPLAKLRAPYLVMSLSFLLCMFMALFIASASGLAMLMMVTVFPILTSLGVSRLGAASVVSTGHLLDIGPSSATTVLVAKTSGMDVGSFFFSIQLVPYIITGLAAAVTHYYWQKHLDKKALEKTNGTDSTVDVRISEKDMDGVAPPGPRWFAVLPMLPLVFLLGFGEHGIKSFKMTVVTAMFLSMAISMVFVLIHKRSLRETLASMQSFFKGMGDQFTMTVTLITSGQAFAFGLQAIGLVSDMVSGSQALGLHSSVIVILICLIIILFSVVMGSGVAPMFAFTPLMPSIAEGIGGSLPNMLVTIQNSASLGRLLSPITAVIVAVSSIAKVSPVELVKRNSLPVAVSMLVSTTTCLMLQ